MKPTGANAVGLILHCMDTSGGEVTGGYQDQSVDERGCWIELSLSLPKGFTVTGSHDCEQAEKNAKGDELRAKKKPPSDVTGKWTVIFLLE